MNLIVIVALMMQASPDAARRQDVYAIYSSLLTTPDELILIQSQYLAPTPTPGCIQPPDASIFGTSFYATEAAELAEIQEDYEQRKNAAPVLTRDLTVSKPYQLLDNVEVERFLKDALDATPQIRPREGPPPNLNPLFPRAKRVFRLSDVYFNKNRTRAAVYFGVYQTPYDYKEQWRVLRKFGDGTWGLDGFWRTCGHISIR